ncbi:acyltransferase [Agarivorans sp. Alg241-V36]|uniref:acyltransferase n=1 Tax=Agarivorans sp. Alg241-V36 TaxID=2305992 RepID=UPI0013D467CF|nr:acyltransferase [Agarivorans sp. Alg241-V36]
MSNYLNLKKKQFRRWLYEKRVRKQAGSIKGSIWCNKKVKVTSNTHLGDNVNFDGAHLSGEGKITIGDNFHSAIGLEITSSWHNYQGKELPFDASWIHKEVVIGNNVWIGENVLILGGANIGDGAVIQARSVVTGNIPALAIAGGHPAKVFSYRDKEHYEQLNQQNAWHSYSWNKYMT